MKHIARILSLLVLLSAGVFFAACDKGDDDNNDNSAEVEAQISALVGTWGATSVSQENEDLSTDYEAFELVITRGTGTTLNFTASGRPEGTLGVWDDEGTLTFGSPVTSQLKRNDGVTFNYSVSGSTLTMTFPNYSGTGYSARTQSVAGDWTFNLAKQP